MTTPCTSLYVFPSFFFDVKILVEIDFQLQNEAGQGGQQSYEMKLEYNLRAQGHRRLRSIENKSWKWL